MRNFASIAKGILKIFASLINQVTRSSLSKVILQQNQLPEINYFYLICFENQILVYPNLRAFAFVFFLSVLMKFLFLVEYFYELDGDSRWAIRQQTLSQIDKYQYNQKIETRFSRKWKSFKKFPRIMNLPRLQASPYRKSPLYY